MTESSPAAAEADAAESADGDASGEAASCRNCGAELVGEYCHDCGQRRAGRLHTRDLVRRFARAALDIDDLGTGLWRTVAGGFVNVGRVARRYVEGERKRYVTPIGYFLLTTTVLFVVFLLFRAEWVEAQSSALQAQWAAMGIDADQAFGPDSPSQQVFGWTSPDDVARWMFGIAQQFSTYVGILICVTVAGALRVLFSGYTFAELVVLELYTVAQAKLVFVCLAPVVLPLYPPALFALDLVPLLVLHAVAGLGFFGTGWKKGILSLLAFAIGYILFLLVFATGVFVAAFWYGFQYAG